MADLHGQTLVTNLQPNSRIAAGLPGQTGADNIEFSDLETQILSPNTGSTFAADIDLSQIQGTYYSAFTQSANISFNFVNAVNGGQAFIRINANGTNTFTFTAIESFGVTTGSTLPSGNYIFRFLQTPYGVSVSVFRGGGITNSAVFGEVPVSDGTDLIGSGLGVTTTSSILEMRSANREFDINSGSVTSSTPRRIRILTRTTLSQSASGEITIQSGNVIGSGNQSGNITIQTGSASSGATRGTITIGASDAPLIINGFTWPTSDGLAGQAIITDGNRVLSFAPIPAGGITNAAANNELSKSDGTNLIASGLFVTSSAGVVNIDSNDAQLVIRSGSTSSSTPRNLLFSTAPTTGIGTSGNVSITTGSSTGVGNNSGNITIQVGSGTSGASRGTITIGGGGGTLILNGLTFPGLDGSGGQVIGTNGSNVLSFVDPLALGTPAQRVTALTSTAGALSIDFNSLSRFREFSLTLNENTTLSFTNDTNRSGFRIYLNVTGATRTITLPATVLMPSDTSNITGVTYNNTSGTLQLAVGRYELKNDFDGTNDYFAITSNYI